MADHGDHADHTGEQVGNYRLIRLLGRGGFADVYLGEHIYLKTQAAIKMLQTRLASTDMEDFLREARMIASLKHPHIVRVIDFGVENGIPFLVMDYAPNGTLRDRHPKGSRLPLLGVAQYVQEVASALQYAHDHRLIHRDVKPENMLVGSDFHVVLSDFGIAIGTQSSRFESTNEVVGTAAYMAPEQLQGKPMPASDQYSLAIIVYEWLCGERPFRGSFVELYGQQIFMPPQPLHELLPTISPEVEAVVLKALSKEPGQRFAKVISFASAFLQACDPTQIQMQFRQTSSSPSMPIVTALPPTLPFPQSQSQSSPSLPNVTPYNPVTPFPPLHQSQSMPSVPNATPNNPIAPRPPVQQSQSSPSLPNVTPHNPITPLPPIADFHEMRPSPLEDATFLTPRSLEDDATYLTPASFDDDATYLTPKPFNSGSTEKDAFAAPLPQPTPSPFPAMAMPLAAQATPADVPARRRNISRRTFVMSMAGLVAITLVGGSVALLAGRSGPGPAAPTTPTPSNPPTATVAPTSTPAPSATAHPTARPTATPTTKPTASPSPQPTATPSPTSTATPSPTPTNTPTPTATATATPSPSPSPTDTPTDTPTPTPTITPTPTGTSPPGITPSPTSLEINVYTFGFRP